MERSNETIQYNDLVERLSGTIKWNDRVERLSETIKWNYQVERSSGTIEWNDRFTTELYELLSDMLINICQITHTSYLVYLKGQIGYVR